MADLAILRNVTVRPGNGASIIEFFLAGPLKEKQAGQSNTNGNPHSHELRMPQVVRLLKIIQRALEAIGNLLLSAIGRGGHG